MTTAAGAAGVQIGYWSGRADRVRDGRLAFEPGERDRRRGRLLRPACDLYPVHRLDAQKAVPLGGSDQPREAGGPGARGSFVLKRKEHTLILGLLAGKHGGVFAGADRDIAGRVGRANEREQGRQPHSAPALVESAPALVAVKVRDQLGVHQRAQLCQGEASGPLDLATDGKRDAASHWCPILRPAAAARISGRLPPYLTPDPPSVPSGVGQRNWGWPMTTARYPPGACHKVQRTGRPSISPAAWGG